MSTRDQLARVISDHQLTGRISIGCRGCPGLEFMHEGDHAEHVADMITEQFLVVPQSDVIGLEYGYRRGDSAPVLPAWDADGAVRKAVAEVRNGYRNAAALERTTLSWSVIPIPEGGETR
ncbi:hypothetical protein [Nocardia sp. CY41]|uniref:hypothetical protein n=1 Tax=Nocardia sp. CY41 TaxID=2608686 RepID=UPI001356D4A6|nr:hypothetical protein [Nocardia sp. CY41]